MSDLFVQKATNNGTTSFSATLNGVVAGNTIVAFLADGSDFAPTTHTVADGQGSYTAQGSAAQDSGNNVYVQAFVLENADAGSHVITGTLDSGDSGDIFVIEVGVTSGAGSFVNAASNFQTNPGAAADAITSTSVTIGAAVTLVGFSAQSSSASGAFTAGTGFASRDAGASGNIGTWIVETIGVATSTAATSGNANGATNNYVSVAVAILNTVTSGPTINTQPQPVTVYQGQAANFSISATTSGGTLHYQWKQGVGNVGTDSNALSISPTTLADNGTSITCEVTDDNDTTISAAALLTVIPTGKTAWIRA